MPDANAGQGRRGDAKPLQGLLLRGIQGIKRQQGLDSSNVVGKAASQQRVRGSAEPGRATPLASASAAASAAAASTASANVSPAKAATPPTSPILVKADPPSSSMRLPARAVAVARPGVAAQRLGVPLRNAADKPGRLQGAAAAAGRIRQQLAPSRIKPNFVARRIVKTQNLSEPARQVATLRASGAKDLQPRATIVAKRRLQLAGMHRQGTDPRSRNIAASLLGHLNSARRRLSEDDGPKIRRTTLVKTSAHRLRHAQMRKQEERRQSRESLVEATEKEMHSLQRRLEGHYAHMKNFIRTQAEPTIFFMPVKHSSQSEEHLEQTRRAIDHKIRSLKTHLKCPPDAIGLEESKDCEMVSSEEEQQRGERRATLRRHDVLIDDEDESDEDRVEASDLHPERSVKRSKR